MEKENYAKWKKAMIYYEILMLQVVLYAKIISNEIITNYIIMELINVIIIK